MSLFLIGALTAKPHAFKARSWELENIETIDIFDSLCSNIRIDIKNSDIVRILPINNQFVNEEWISDKTRFGYDGLKRWRFIYPMYKHNNVYLQISWDKLFNILKEKIKEIKFDSVVIKTGTFTDLETLIALQRFCEQTNNITLNHDLLINFDIKNYFFDTQYLENNKVYIFIGTNLRYENPILNIKFKKLTKTKLLLGYIGVKHETTFEMLHLGVNLITIKNIVQGKHTFVKLIKMFFKDNLNIKNKISLIFGKDFNNKNDSYILNKYFKDSINNIFTCSFLQESVGKLNVLTTGSVINKSIDHKKKNFYYIVGAEYLQHLNNESFFVFQGHHNDKLRTKFDVIMPTLTWTEKSALYFNTFGFLQRTNFVSTPPVETRLDWKVVRIMSILFDKDIMYFNTADIYKILNKSIPSFKNYILKYKRIVKHEIRFSKKILKYNFMIEQNPFITYYPYYTMLNSIERASKTLNLVFNNLRKDESNFIK